MAAEPAAPVTVVPATAAVTVELALDAEDDDPAQAVEAAAAAEDDEDEVDGGGVANGEDVSVPPETTLSGAFGWPPSSGDGAILESVKRREIISGRQRRPPPCTGSPGTFLFL